MPQLQSETVTGIDNTPSVSIPGRSAYRLPPSPASHHVDDGPRVGICNAKRARQNTPDPRIWPPHVLKPHTVGATQQRSRGGR